MQIGVLTRGVSVVIVVNAVTSVEVVVVATAGQFVETRGGVAELAGRHPDLGGEFIPALRRFSHARLQPGSREFSPGGHRCTRDLWQRKMSGDDIEVEGPMIGDEPARNM